MRLTYEKLADRFLSLANRAAVLAITCGFSAACVSRDLGESSAPTAQATQVSREQVEGAEKGNAETTQSGSTARQTSGHRLLSELEELRVTKRGEHLDHVRQTYAKECTQQKTAAPLAELCRLLKDEKDTKRLFEYLCSWSRPAFCEPSLKTIALLEELCGQGEESGCFYGTLMQASPQFRTAEAQTLCRLAYSLSCARVMTGARRSDDRLEAAHLLCGAELHEMWALRSLPPVLATQTQLHSGLQTFAEINAFRNEICENYVQGLLDANRNLEVSVVYSRLCIRATLNEMGPPGYCQFLSARLREHWSVPGAEKELQRYCSKASETDCALALGGAGISGRVRQTVFERLEQMCKKGRILAACDVLIVAFEGSGNAHLARLRQKEACAIGSLMGCFILVIKGFQAKEPFNLVAVENVCTNPRSLLCVVVVEGASRDPELPLKKHREAVCGQYPILTLCKKTEPDRSAHHAGPEHLLQVSAGRALPGFSDEP